MQTVFTLISLILSFLSGGFVVQGNPQPGSEDWDTTRTSLTLEAESLETETGPWTSSGNARKGDEGDLGTGLDPWG